MADPGGGATPGDLISRGRSRAQSEKIYAEALDFILAVWTQRSLIFHGDFFLLDDLPKEHEPLQKPHPPIWYGVHAPDSAARAAQKGLRVVSLDPLAGTCASFTSFRAAWREAGGDAPLPLMGVGRFLVGAESDAAALALARRAYRR